MENNPSLLKSSMFGGFKKKDVLSYIFELNEATQDEKQRLAEQIEELAQSRESLSASVSEMEQKIAGLEASLDDATVRLDEGTKKNAEYEELIGRLKTETSKHESIISQQNAEIAHQTELNAKLSEKNREHEEKRRQVELAAEQIAGLLNQAKSDAEHIVDRAKLEAESMIKNAKSAAQVHVDEANSSVVEAYKKVSGLRAELDDLQKTVTNTASVMTEKMQSLKDDIEDIEKSAPEMLSTDALPVLQYEKEADSTPVGTKDINPVAATSAAISSSTLEAEAADMTTSILRRYGVRKDDSGFFRLASE